MGQTIDLKAVLVMPIILSLFIGCATGKKQDSELEFEEDLPEVSEIRFRGNKQFSPRNLRGAMTTKLRPWYQPWKRNDLFNPATLDADLLRLRKFYFDRGFLTATAELTEIKEDPESNRVSLVITIEEGPRTKVASVQLDVTLPSEVPSKEQPLKDLPSQEGKPLDTQDFTKAKLMFLERLLSRKGKSSKKQDLDKAKQKLLKDLPLRARKPLNKQDFEKSKERLELVMKNASYARAKVTAHTDVDADKNKAQVTFTLQPGEPTKFGRITVKGASKVPERVVRRALVVREGKPYSAKKLKDSQKNVFELGMYRSVTPRLLNIDEKGTPLDVEFEVRERKPRSFRLGVGASSVESMRYQVEWNHRNLFGEAEWFSALATVSGILQGVELRLTEPHLFNRKTSLTNELYFLNKARIQTDPTGILDDLFNIKDPFPNYDLLVLGGRSRVDYDISKKWGASFGLELEHNDFYNIKKSAEDEGIEDNTLFVQFLEAERSTRDNKLNPTKGTLVTGKVDHSNTSLLSDANFVKLTAEGRYFIPLLRRTVLATRLKIGGIEPYGGTDTIPANVRFYAGGPGSVRGYSLNRLGPSDVNGKPIGGNSLLEGSVELRHRFQGNFGAAVFFDFGNVFSTSFTYRINDLRLAVGPGIRYHTPIGPIRADFGFIIDRRDEEDIGRFEFSIGQAF